MMSRYGAGLALGLSLLLAACQGSVSGGGGAGGSTDPGPTAGRGGSGAGGRGGSGQAGGGSGGVGGQAGGNGETGGSGGRGGGQAGSGGAGGQAGGGSGGALGSDAGAGRGGAGGGAGAGGAAGAAGGPSIGDGGSPMAGPAGPWARGVSVGVVEITQAVFIKIGQGATVIDPAMRNAPVIEGRPLYVRTYVVPGAGFTARRLRGVVNVEYEGGASKGFEDSKMIAGASDSERLDSTLNVLIPAEDVRPGSSLSVSIYETGEATGADPATLPRFPATGAAPLAVKAGRMVLDVVAMPVSGPMGALMDTPERRRKLEMDLYDLYPVQKVNLRIREPLVVTERLASSTPGFAALREARTKDAAKPGEYYHLLVGRADINASYAGVASGAGAGVNDAARRVGITIVGTRAVDGNTNTTAHEIGHNHGRNHAPACGATGDSMYPLPNGQMEVSGFSLSEMALKSKARFRELMGYCRPRWISDYQWRALEVRVRAVSAFAATGGAPGMTSLDERSLQGFVSVGGREAPDWGVVTGALVPDGTAVTADRRARLTLADGRALEVPVLVELMSDDLTREIAVNLPAGEEVVAAEVTIDGQRFSVPVASLPVP
jgi:hypothetical protein